jgi:hypothetical protein
MYRMIVLVLCAFACSTADARGRAAPRGDLNAESRASEAGAYPRAENVAPVTRYRARQDIAGSDYIDAALDDGDGSDGANDNAGGGNGGGNSYTGGGGYGGGGGARSTPAPMPMPMSFSGTVHGSYAGDGNDGIRCVYKAVMTDAEIATCKAASIAEMRRHRSK